MRGEIGGSKFSVEPEIAPSDFPEEQPHLMEQVVGPLFEDDAFTMDSEDSVDEILAPVGCRCIEVEFGFGYPGDREGALVGSKSFGDHGT